MWSAELLNKEKGLSTSGVEFSAPPCSTVHPNLKVEMVGSSQEEEEEGDAMNGDYNAGSSPAKRGVKRKRKGKDGGNAGRPKKVKVTPPPPAAVTLSTTTAPPVNAVLGGEDMTVIVNNAVVPVFPFRPRQRRTMGPTKRRMEMERPSRTGRKTRTGNDESGMWTCLWDRAFLRLVRWGEWCGRFMLDGPCTFPAWVTFSPTYKGSTFCCSPHRWVPYLGSP